ncbi:hypothetical protein ABZW02_25720 [Streptomyces sp. NPDC005180]|uniref:hypothetical protein n=1 Tax=Streptomyces sp. NPDC005180 TaxID=3156868 RepID=UPI0033B8573F
MTTPQQPYQGPSADDFLMGGVGAPSASFLTVGTTVSGRITERPTVQQQRDMKTGENKFWPDGNPMMQLVVTVQTDERDPSTFTDDDGRRRLFVKNQMKSAVADAVRATGARGLEVGGVLSITFTHELPPKQRGFNPIKQYSATYTPAAQAALHTPDPGTLASAPAPAPQQPASPAVPGLSPEQLQAALANPATAALLAQQQAQAAATPPPF